MLAVEEPRAVITPGRSYWNGPRPGSLAFSLLGHLGAVFFLFWFSDVAKTFVEPAPDEQVVAPQNEHIVWYHLKEIPKISSDTTENINQVRAERSNPDVIIHDAPDAAHDNRLVLRTPDPKVPELKTPAADMIAVARGSDATKTPEKPVEAKPAPVAARPDPKPFVAPTTPPPAAAAQVKLLEPPPTVDAPKLVIPDSSLSALTAGGKVRYSKRFVPPPPAKRPAPNEVGGAGDLPPDAPALPGSGGVSDVNALIVNVIHSAAIDAPPPRPSAVSVGPVTGSGSDKGGPSGMQIGGVTVAPGPGKPDTTTEASLKNPKDQLRRAPNAGSPPPYIVTRIAPLEHTVSAPLPPSSRNLPRLIEARFRGRIVYTMLLPMKGLPGYAGDWTIWFAERQYAAGGGSGAQMRAPLPVRKPIRADLALAVSPGEVRLSATMNAAGKMDSIVAIDGSSPGAEAAIADLQSWEFLPALRNLEPVEIDLVVEIPFGIKPKNLSPARVPVLSGVDRPPETSHN